MRDFVIQLHDLDDDGKDYDLPIEGRWLSEALQDTALKSDPTAGPGRLVLHAQRSGQDVLVQGNVQARVLAECGRCLGDVPLDVRADLTMLFTARAPHQRSEPVDQELTPEDLDREYFTGTQIVLDAIIRDHIVLEVPMQPTCEADCQGAPEIPEGIKPPAEAFDRKRTGVDPRLAALKDLAAKMPRDKE